MTPKFVTMPPPAEESHEIAGPVRVLLIEPTLADAETCVAELRRSGLEVLAHIVDTPHGFNSLITTGEYDIVLSDYHLPKWTGMDALASLRERGLQTPFIVVANPLADEHADACMRDGATDYVAKTDMHLLSTAVRRAIVEHRAAGATPEDVTERRAHFANYLQANVTDELPAVAPLVLPRGTETVLLVEDSPPVRSAVRLTLERLGYTVLEAGDGPSAIAYAKSPRPIDLVLTDVMMPGMNGRDVALQVQAMRRGIPVLFMSGYADHNKLTEGMDSLLVAYLQKPFELFELATKIRMVLDAADMKEIH